MVVVETTTMAVQDSSIICEGSRSRRDNLHGLTRQRHGLWR